MCKKIKYILIGFLILMVLSPLMSQTGDDTIESAPTNATDTRQDSIPSSEGELVLDNIEITGSVEKPGLIIIPKRVEPKLEKIDLERDFNKEVNEGLGEMVEPATELNRVDRVKSIKKTVERERN